MSIEFFKNMQKDELRNEYKKYLRQFFTKDSTVNTSSIDAFYLWNNVNREVFWEKILSDKFEIDFKTALLRTLQEKSKGNPAALVNGYMLHARKFRDFISKTELIHKEQDDSGVPRPSVKEVEFYLKEWKNLDIYSEQEEALNKLFFLCPENKDMSDILLKVATHNDFYSTNIYSIYSVAKHILSLQIDTRLKTGDITLVSDIKKITINKVEKNFYSFATKYCSLHNPREYPIYDNYVRQILIYFKKKDGFSNFKNDDLKDYNCFKSTLECFRIYYDLNQYDLKEIDKYIWQLGKKYFFKKY